MGNTFLYILLTLLLLFASFVMILLVLIQRGRGGGLAGAFGGMGGQSAFGTRAGDIFTKITVVVAVVWVLSAGLLGISMRSRAEAEASGQRSDYQDPAGLADDEAAAEDEAETKTADDESDQPLVEPTQDATSSDAEGDDAEADDAAGADTEAPPEAANDSAAADSEAASGEPESQGDTPTDDSESSN